MCIRDSFNTLRKAVRGRPGAFVRATQDLAVSYTHLGKSGEEIWTDQYGRVVVQFFWDRQGTSNENSSCWIRVAQGWAGKQWGYICIPRIGQEVIVSFLEGDPDRPIITGSVYNAVQMPPYTLPDLSLIHIYRRARYHARFACAGRHAAGCLPAAGWV